jgi:hypothetical protein
MLKHRLEEKGDTKMNALKKLIPILMIVVMLFITTAATPTAAATVQGCKQWHIVQRGEYLSQIARLYNTTYQKLAEINELKDPNLIYVGQSLCVSIGGTTTTPPPSTLPNTGAGVRVYATSVKEDQSVTLQGKSLSADTTYTIYLSNYKSKQSVSYSVGAVTTNKEGGFKGTYNLPGKLADVSLIKVIVTNGKGDTASNWFYNMTTDKNTGGVGSPTLNFTIVSVDKGKTVKIQANNLLPNVKYQITMGKSGTLGIGGINVGTLRDSKGGTVTATFDIPEDLANRSKLDLRIEYNPFEISAYQSFNN